MRLCTFWCIFGDEPQIVNSKLAKMATVPRRRLLETLLVGSQFPSHSVTLAYMAEIFRAMLQRSNLDGLTHIQTWLYTEQVVLYWC